MKLLKGFALLLAICLTEKTSFSQGTDTLSDEQYCRANIAVTEFKKLGVSETGFAKCAVLTNFLEAEKKPKVISIAGEKFFDDGKNHDLVAGDGVLTSEKIFAYPKGEVIVPVGRYGQSNNNIIYDDGFTHAGKINPNKIKISCKWVWVKCSSWPAPIQELCYEFCWPFTGSWELTECTIVYES